MESGASPCASTRSVTFSPWVVGRIAMRTSMLWPPRLIETRPSWGARRSAMSRPPMILRRLEIADAWDPAMEVSSRMTPSTRIRTKTRRCCGVKWMSEAPRSSAFEMARLMNTTAGVSCWRSSTVASSSVSAASVTTSSMSTVASAWMRLIAASIASAAATHTRTGTPRASRSSSENMTLVGSATATITEPSSRKWIGRAR